MAGQVIVNKFRETFSHTKSALKLFPMHMARSLVKVQSILKDIDCVIEVHDARIPISGRNSKFEDALAARPRMLLLNKADLIDSRQLERVTDYIKCNDPSVKQILYSCCKSDTDDTIKNELLPSVMDIVKSGDRFNRSENLDYNVLVIGVPNVGKSTLINALRHVHLKKGGKATSVGAKPGITRNVLEKIKVSEIPRIYVLDTPGILQPTIPNMDVAFKLALCDTIRGNVLGEINMADYLLFILNKQKNFSYVDLYELPQPVDDIYILLIHIAKKQNKFLKLKSHTGGRTVRPDFLTVSSSFIRDFRLGKMGKIMLDADWTT